MRYRLRGGQLKDNTRVLASTLSFFRQDVKPILNGIIRVAGFRYLDILGDHESKILHVNNFGARIVILS